MLAMAFKTILPGTYEPFKYVTTKLRLASQQLVDLLLLNYQGIARRTGTRQPVTAGPSTAHRCAKQFLYHLGMDLRWRIYFLTRGRLKR